LINSLALSHEHNLQFCSFWIVVYEFSQSFVNVVLFNRNIDSNALLQIDDVAFQSFDFIFSIF
jgi:hypothetical protein